VSTVLIIDDDPDGCEPVASYLAKAGHEVRCVTSGRDALDAVMGQVPDAVLLDVLMPDMDGIAVLKVIRSYLQWAAVPIAILTAYPEDPRLWHVSRYGVTHVFTKSKVNLDELLWWVEQQPRRVSPPSEQPGPSPHHGL
jgi:CheY-like chemotaxis protein